MFGYSKYYKDELKYKDFRRYSNYYCALCDTLGHEFGLMHRLFLSYDTTFILICLDSIVGDKNAHNFRCPFNPFRKVSMLINEDVLEYVAFLNYFLIVQKIKDNIRDEKTCIKRMFWKVILRLFSSNKKYCFFQLKYKNISNNLTDLFDKLYNMECNGQSFDDITNTFGEISKSFVKGILTNISSFDNNSLTALESIFFNMGKWIYIADALDDYHTDIKKDRFNLLSTLQLDNNDDKGFRYAKSCALLLDIIHAKMIKAFSFVKWKHSKDIISNILFYGTANTFRTIIRRHYTPKQSVQSAFHGGLVNWISRTLNR